MESQSNINSTGSREPTHHSSPKVLETIPLDLSPSSIESPGSEEDYYNSGLDITPFRNGNLSYVTGSAFGTNNSNGPSSGSGNKSNRPRYNRRYREQGAV